MALDISSLINATNQLDIGLSRFRLDESDEQIRDGLIQRFEFTYELSHKMIKRFLEMYSADPTLYDQMNFQDIIRHANERQLIKGNWLDWKLYRHLRGKTSHTYDEAVAKEVVQSIPQFLAEAQFLCASLEKNIT